MKPGGFVYMPREHKHFVQAKGETTVQLQGVGPWHHLRESRRGSA
jgi:hypothetical protein